VDLPAAQRLYYAQLFKIADADGDGVIGLNDSAFFRKSNLPNTVLGEVIFIYCHFICSNVIILFLPSSSMLAFFFVKVWQLSDSKKEGRLDKDGFIIALCLISLAQQGKRLGLDTLRSYGTC
jgi:hypothetical protein